MIPPYHQWLLCLSAIPIVHLAVIPTSSKMVYLVWIEIYIPHLLLVSLLNREARPKSDGNRHTLANMYQYQQLTTSITLQQTVCQMRLTQLVLLEI